MRAAEISRLTATFGIATGMLLGIAWLGPAAWRTGLPGMAALAALLAPLGIGLHGLLCARLRTGRWLSLALPFYGAGLLVSAAGDPQARGWITAGAFCMALAFAAVLSWVRQAGQSALPRSRT